MTARIIPISLIIVCYLGKFLPDELWTAPPDVRKIRLLVTRIIDGDSFEGRASGQLFRIRLNGIDAPEKKQDFYKASRTFLGQLCMDSPVQVLLIRQDRYKRWLADVYNASGVHINREMVAQGMAWHFKKYSKDSTLSRLETEARNRKRGLWQMPGQVPPWEFRKTARHQ